MMDWNNWNDVQWLLRAEPKELMADSALLRHLRQVAKSWSDHPELEPEERNRIRAVWMEGEYRPGLPVTTARWNLLRTLR